MDTFSAWAVPLLLLLIPVLGLCKRLPVYELFVSGAADGARLCVSIFPNILAMLVVIGVFAVLALRGTISADNAMIIISMVVSFYFGTQHEKPKVTSG